MCQTNLTRIFQNLLSYLKMTRRDTLTGVDLFCGIGSFHLAMRMVGIETMLACDIEPSVCATYEANHGLAPTHDIHDIECPMPNLTMLCAGFPCQPFSSTGNRQGIHDSKNGDLLGETLRLIGLWRPKTIVLENVTGFLSWNSGSLWHATDQALSELGYSTVWLKMDCSEWGTPQHRERIFGLGVREDLLLRDDAQLVHPVTFTAQLSSLNIVTPTLGDFLRDSDIVVKRAPTIRCGGKESPPGTSWNWNQYLRKDGSYHKVSLDEAMLLQGFNPSNWHWRCTTAQGWHMIGNTVPLTLSCVAVTRLKPYLDL